MDFTTVLYGRYVIWRIVFLLVFSNEFSQLNNTAYCRLAGGTVLYFKTLVVRASLPLRMYCIKINFAVKALRDLIEKQADTNLDFKTAVDKFWGICKQSILDIRKMMIQHILTEDIFINIFNESQFHRENTAQCLYMRYNH